MKIILIGYRATGKSTVGKLLADILKVPFYDTDQVIEEKLDLMVRDIIGKRGWDYFRQCETEALHFLKEKKNCIIATGGGIILKKENLDLLKEMGKVIWLNASLHDIVERLKADAKSEKIRPKFTNDSLVQETTSMLKERIPIYRKAADCKVDTAGKTATQVANEIYKLIKKL